MRNRFTTRNQWFTETIETIRTSGLTLIISTIRFSKPFKLNSGLIYRWASLIYWKLPSTVTKFLNQVFNFYSSRISPLLINSNSVVVVFNFQVPFFNNSCFHRILRHCPLRQIFHLLWILYNHPATCIIRICCVIDIHRFIFKFGFN